MSDLFVTFSELEKAGSIEVGAGRPRTVQQRYPEIPILRVADVLNGRIEASSQIGVPQIISDSSNSKMSRPGDIVLTTKGTVGRVAMIPADGPTFAYSPQLCYFRPASNGPLRPNYLYYWFQTDQFWNQANALKGQTDMADYLSLKDTQALKISVPPLKVQDSVADVLQALDDKITVNSQISATSIALADDFYQLASTRITFSNKTFGSTASIHGGGTPSTTDESYWEGEIPWATPSDVTALGSPYLFDTTRHITKSGLINCASQLYPAGSIFMTSRATIGELAVPQVPSAVNQGFIVVLPNDEKMRWWLFHQMRSRLREILSLANGSTFLEISRRNFKSMSVLMPSDEEIRQFDSRVAPLHKRAAESSSESSVLRDLRSTLLPKLFSGQISVRDAEKIVEDVI